MTENWHSDRTEGIDGILSIEVFANACPGYSVPGRMVAGGYEAGLTEFTCRLRASRIGFHGIAAEAVFRYEIVLFP